MNLNKKNRSMIILMILIAVVLSISISSVSASNSSNSNLPESQGIATIMSLVGPGSIYEGNDAEFSTILVNKDSRPVSDEKVILNVNKKQYIATTDSKGVANFKVSNLATGKLKVSAVYYGSIVYAGSVVNSTITVKPLADLTITKIKRSGDYYRVTIKNQGSTASGKFMLGLCVIKKANNKKSRVNSIAAGKSTTVTIKFFKHSAIKGRNVYALVNYNKYAKESNYSNNKAKIRV